MRANKIARLSKNSCTICRSIGPLIPEIFEGPKLNKGEISYNDERPCDQSLPGRKIKLFIHLCTDIISFGWNVIEIKTGR